VTGDSTLQRSVRNAVNEVTAADDRLRVTGTMANLGWGGVLFVDVYAQSGVETLEDLDHALRKVIALFTDRPVERVTVRWRLNL
jgi:hypothetical protein